MVIISRLTAGFFIPVYKSFRLSLSIALFHDRLSDMVSIFQVHASGYWAAIFSKESF
jgi:hypothetical protein